MHLWFSNARGIPREQHEAWVPSRSMQVRSRTHAHAPALTLLVLALLVLALLVLGCYRGGRASAQGVQALFITIKCFIIVL
jgi:hypothetical protein